MVEDDFDKELENDEFADEFDFVDEEHDAAPVTQKSMPEQEPMGKIPGSNKNYIIYGVAGVVVLIAVFVAIKHIGSEKPAVAKPPATLANAPQQSSPANSEAVPSYESAAPGAGSMTQPEVNSQANNQLPSNTTPNNMVANNVPLPKPSSNNGNIPAENNVDFNQAFDNASKNQLENALPPQSKTFDQVQRELKAANTKPTLPPEINATLDSISEEMTLNVNQIKHLETTITNLAATVDQLNKSISAMDNRVLGLTETVDGLAQDLSNVKKVMADEDIDLTGNNKVRFSGAKKQTINNTSPDYSVHAIIPGRAWLKNSSGQIITVTEGDKVGDFGTVAVIDAANGIVRTSSGITFR